MIEYISYDLMAEQLALEDAKIVFGSPTSLGSPVLASLIARRQGPQFTSSPSLS